MLHHHFSVTFTKDFILSSAFATFIVSHIFNNTQDIDSKILEHLDSFNDINESQSLWSWNDDSSIKFDLLTKTDLNISCSWWEIDNQIIKFSPSCIKQKLRQYFWYHDTSHSSRFWSCEPERHTFHFLINDWFDLFWIIFCWSESLLLLVDQCRKRGTINISVKDTDFESFIFQSSSNIDSNSTFTNTTFTTADCDYFFDLLQVFLLCEFLLFSLWGKINVNIRESIFFQIFFNQTFKSSVIFS